MSSRVYKKCLTLKKIKLNKTYWLIHNYRQTAHQKDNSSFVVVKAINRSRIILRRADNTPFSRRIYNHVFLKLPISTMKVRWSLYEIEEELNRTYINNYPEIYKEYTKYINFFDLKANKTYHPLFYNNIENNFLPHKNIKSNISTSNYFDPKWVSYVDSYATEDYGLIFVCRYYL